MFTKNSQVISFRFGAEALEALKAQQQSGESLSQTAQRLLRQYLALSTESKVGSTVFLSTKYPINVYGLIELRLAPIHERLKHLEEMFLKVTSPLVDKTLDNVDTLMQQDNEMKMEQEREEREQFDSQIAALQAENELLRQQNHQLQKHNQELEHELNSVVVPAAPDYEALRSLILKSMTTGTGSFAKTSPQYRAASKALTKLIEAITISNS